MPDTKEPLIRDLVQWCARETRSYAEVLDAWRTSCPRLTVWEDAVEQGLLETRPSASGLTVEVTDRGRAMLADVAPPPAHGVAVPAMAAVRT